MSRVGKQPVSLPQGVDVKINGQDVQVKGPKGTLNRRFHDLVEIQQADGELRVKPRETSQTARAMWGLSRALLNNMVLGVSQGFTRVLEINGVGYRAELKGDTINLALGFSHPVEFKLPSGISAAVEKIPRSPSPGSIRNCWVSPPPASAPLDRRSPTRAKASSTPKKPSAARWARPASSNRG